MREGMLISRITERVEEPELQVLQVEIIREYKRKIRDDGLNIRFHFYGVYPNLKKVIEVIDRIHFENGTPDKIDIGESCANHVFSNYNTMSYRYIYKKQPTEVHIVTYAEKD